MFTFFKELWKLITMLFTSKPKEYTQVELMEMNKFPFSGYKYMMWCGKMIYRYENKERIEAEIGTESHNKSVRHETFHLKQAQIKGKNSWVRYYLIYAWEWVKGNPIIHPASSAYYTIPFEMEAYANKDDASYLDNYDGRYLHCYDIKDRKNTYRKYGNSRAWKEYVKTIEKVAE